MSPLSASAVENASESVQHFDFDVIVVQLADVLCVKAGVHFSWEKWMGPISATTGTSLKKPHGSDPIQKNGGDRVGIHGWGLLSQYQLRPPANPNCTRAMFRSEMMAKAHAIGLINALFKHFTDRLKSLPPEDLERPTIFKNSLNSLGRMNVLHGDQNFILKLFYQSLLAVNSDLDMSILLTITKFGHKDEQHFDDFL